MKKILIPVAAAFILSTTFSCSNSGDKKQTTEAGADSTATESKKANEFFDKSFDELLARHPMQEAYLGLKKDFDKWDDISDKAANEDIEIVKRQLEDLKKNINPEKLDGKTKISYELFERKANEQIDKFKYRFHNYPVNQEDGLHQDAPTFLINVHSVDNVDDARAYIARLKGIKPLFTQLLQNLKLREEKGIIPPRFVFAKVDQSCKNIIQGQPFDNSSRASDLLEDFRKKVRALKGIDKKETDALETEASNALKDSVKPAYLSLIAYMSALSKKATTDAGAWKFPDGQEYYANAIKYTTTTDLTPDEVYALGQKEVARIHAEIHDIMKKVKFRNDNLQDFLKFMTTDKQFYYPNTEAGRNEYFKQANGYIDNMRNKLDEIFITKPKAPLEVKKVEAYREKSTGQAFYDAPSPDGKRPGHFYINMGDMSIVPVYQLEALAYHEGIPGHHMQIAISLELQGVPKFRKFGSYTAYEEGWGLYTERLGKEMGFYQDPYQDFGRLSMELLRAARLVVDPAIHSKKWTREQAIKYFEENTAEPKGECEKAIERYIVWPGQATAYKIGMNKIMDLREMAKQKLGSKFSIREFHDVFLTAGPVPMSVLEEIVNNWIASKQKV